MRRFLLPSLIALGACATGGRPDATPPGRSVSTVEGARIEVLQDAVGPGTAAAVARALPGAVRRAGRWGPLRAATIVVHGSERRFREAVGETGRAALRAWTRGGVVHLRDPGAWEPFAATAGELEQVLAHELVHCAMDERLGPAAPPPPPVPFWFREGMAMERLDDGEERALRARLRALEGRPLEAPGASALGRAGAALPGHPDLAYALAYVAFRTLVARHGEPAVGRILDAMRSGTGFEAAFAAATGAPLASLDAEVRRAIRDGA